MPNEETVAERDAIARHWRNAENEITELRIAVTEAIETLERVGCQFNLCDGPTLTPVPMVTCHACDTLARLRVAVGRPARRDDEQTAAEAHAERYDLYMKSCISPAAWK